MHGPIPASTCQSLRSTTLKWSMGRAFAPSRAASGTPAGRTSRRTQAAGRRAAGNEQLLVDAFWVRASGPGRPVGRLHPDLAGGAAASPLRLACLAFDRLRRHHRNLAPQAQAGDEGPPRFGCRVHARYAGLHLAFACEHRAGHRGPTRCAGLGCSATGVWVAMAGASTGAGAG